MKWDLVPLDIEYSDGLKDGSSPKYFVKIVEHIFSKLFN